MLYIKDHNPKYHMPSRDGNMEQYMNDLYSEDICDVFFYGDYLDESAWITHPKQAMRMPSKCHICPQCGAVTTVKKYPEDGELANCKQCGQDGIFYNFRDKELPLDMVNPVDIAYLECLDRGYCLRLYEVGFDYSNREYDDICSLTHYPDLNVCECAREYWYNGKVEYYVNRHISGYGAPVFERVEILDDYDYYIVNYDNEYDPMFDSVLVGDILYQAQCDNKPFIAYLASKISNKAFNTLARYGFDTVLEDMVYLPYVFADSNKISEVLSVDYNKLISQYSVKDFTMSELLTARRLKESAVAFTKANMDIARKCNNELLENSKSFKYMRNLVSRMGTLNVISDYCDYIKDCNKLGYDLSDRQVRYPSNFASKHVEYATQVAMRDNEKYVTDFKQIYDTNSVIDGFCSGDFIIKLAKYPADLLFEGKILGHCVGGYASRVVDGNCLIFMIRRLSQEDVPYFTLEYSLVHMKVVQCRGFKNIDYVSNVEVKSVLGEWELWIKEYNENKFKKAM